MTQQNIPGVGIVDMVNDSPHRLRKELKAKILKHGEGETDLPAPPEGASVIGRSVNLSAPIPVQQVDWHDDGRREVLEGGSLHQEQAVKQAAAGDPENAVYAERPETSDPVGVESYAVPAYTEPEPAPRVGVQPVQRQTANLGETQPIYEERQTHEVKSTHVKPNTTPVPQETAVASSEGIGVEPPPQQVVSRPKCPVIFESTAMGKHRVKVPKVAVGDSVIIVFYSENDDGVIVEPPVCDELYITVEGTKHRCAYRDMSLQTEIDGQPMLLVVLLRIPD